MSNRRRYQGKDLCVMNGSCSGVSRVHNLCRLLWCLQNPLEPEVLHVHVCPHTPWQCDPVPQQNAVKCSASDLKSALVSEISVNVGDSPTVLNLKFSDSVSNHVSWGRAHKCMISTSSIELLSILLLAHETLTRGVVLCTWQPCFSLCGTNISSQDFFLFFLVFFLKFLWMSEKWSLQRKLPQSWAQQPLNYVAISSVNAMLM